MDVINMFDLHAANRKGVPVVPEKPIRRDRAVKIYENPQNGEMGETVS